MVNNVSTGFVAPELLGFESAWLPLPHVAKDHWKKFVRFYRRHP